MVINIYIYIQSYTCLILHMLLHVHIFESSCNIYSVALVGYRSCHEGGDAKAQRLKSCTKVAPKGGSGTCRTFLQPQGWKLMCFVIV